MRLNRNFVVRATSLACAVLFLTSCSQEPQKSESIDTAASVSITSEQEAKYSRVIALANGSAEIIAALGQRKILVGRDIASTDAELASIPIVSSGHQIIAETVLGKKPDLVLIDGSSGPAQALEVIKASGVRIVMVSEIWNLGEISGKIEKIAEVIGVPQDGAKLATLVDANVGSAEKIPATTKIAFLYLRGGSAIYLIGGEGSGADSLIEAIGGVDIGAQRFAQPFTALTSEALLSLNPDLLLVMTKGLESVGGTDGLLAIPGIAQTTAGKKSRIIAVDDSLLLSFGPRTPDLVKKLSAEIKRQLDK